MMVTAMLFLSSFLSFGLLAYAQLPSSPGGFPLAVKTPYLHSWIFDNNQTAPEQIWPTVFTQNKILGWNGMIRVDNKSYQWLGAFSGDSTFSTTVASGSRITPTTTIFTIHAGPMRFNATFFSPIEPNNYTRQSIPFTYLFVDGFMADDTISHTIQLYSDISAEWVTHDLTTPVIWDTNVSTSVVYHHVQSQNPKRMVENSDVAEDSTAYYATPEESFVSACPTTWSDRFLQRSGLTWQTGAAGACRNMFALNGNLTNSKDTAFRAVNDHWPALSFAIDLGSVSPNSNPLHPVVWTLGIVRDPLVSYSTESGFQPRTAYYWSSYQNIDDVISDFLRDFPDARRRGQTFDDHIVTAASAISSEYTGILSLVTRQVFASMDITIPTGEVGQLNASDVKIFMKDLSVSTRANPVEVIYAALPALIYFNSSFVHDLLVPLLEFQSSSNYPNSYASPDLGGQYPIIIGNVSATEELAIEHCGNMLIMTYAHAVKSSDNSLISKYHSLLQKWADYLVQNSLYPNNAISADGIGYPGMSNLALKGILGVYSMGKIDEIMKSSNTTFKDKANELVNEWKGLAVTDTHIQAQYGQSGTWGLMYNLFPAVWLETGLIDDDILKREAQFYISHAPPEGQSYSLDSRGGNGIAYPHWALMTAGMIPSSYTQARQALIKSTYLQAYNASQTFPLPMRYSASTGTKLYGTIGSPAQGAAFGILAMSASNDTGTGGGINAPTDTRGGPIVGGVIGGLAFLLMILSAIFFWRRHKIRARVVINPLHGHYTESYPFSYQHISSNRSESASLPEPQRNKRLYSDGRGKYLPVAITTSQIPPNQLLSKKQRGALEQAPNPESTVPNPTNPNHGTGFGRNDALRADETLRAEVEALRREMEAIRNIAQPPPDYQ